MENQRRYAESRIIRLIEDFYGQKGNSNS